MNPQSDNINELILALSKAQGSLGAAKKDKKNPFFKSNYADLSSVWDACRAALSSNQLAVVQGASQAEDGSWMLVTTLAHSSGQWMRSCMPIITQKTDSQSLGSAITYTKRYSLSAMVGVSTGEGEDDDGEKAMGDRKGKSQTLRASSSANSKEWKIDKSKKISADHVAELEQLINGHDDIRERMITWVKSSFKGKSLNDIPDYQFSKMKRYCEMAIEDKYKNESKKSAVAGGE